MTLYFFGIYILVYSSRRSWPILETVTDSLHGVTSVELISVKACKAWTFQFRNLNVWHLFLPCYFYCWYIKITQWLCYMPGRRAVRDCHNVLHFKTNFLTVFYVCFQMSSDFNHVGFLGTEFSELERTEKSLYSWHSSFSVSAWHVMIKNNLCVRHNIYLIREFMIKINLCQM